SYRDLLRTQHTDYQHSLDHAIGEVQKRFWDEAVKARREYERLIHEELRIVRQRVGQLPALPAGTTPSPTHEPAFDYARFAERFRGPEDYVRKNIQFYRDRFQDHAPVLDIGCGRGEFLELMRDSGVEARGVDLSEESVAICRSKGLTADRADLFDYLRDLPDRALGGIFCAQVVEHLPPSSLPDMIR